MKPVKYFLFLIIFSLLLGAGVMFYVNWITSYGMPSLEQLENPPQMLATQVYSSDGKLLDHLYYEKRVSLPYDSIPKDFVNALVATEDKKFWEHWGVHIGRVFNAAIKNVFMGDREGASTITMQLARNLFQFRENSMERKIRESIVAMQIEKTYTKKEIIELYTNTVNYGRSAFGIQVASQMYFDKNPNELTTAECALLVAMLKAPSNYNPVTKYNKAFNRRNLVLDLMLEQGYINEAEHTKAAMEPIIVFKSDKKQKKQRRTWGNELAPHFVEMIRQDLGKSNDLEGLDLYKDGLIIHTTLNSTVQKYANEAVAEHLSTYQQSIERAWNWGRKQDVLNQILNKAIAEHPKYRASDKVTRIEISNQLKRDKKFVDSIKNAALTIQVGLVVIEPATGAIIAMVGSSPKFMAEHPDAKYSLNHATQIKRQPGSSFKPFVYACALENGYNPSTMVECGPFSYSLPTGEVWSPSGTGDCGAGEKTSLSQALKMSINTVAARLVTSITTPTEVIAKARKMGINTPLSAVPAISLGAGGDVSPLEITSAYGTFAHNGIHINPYYFTRIEDHQGNLIKEKRRSYNFSPAMTADIATQMTIMLQGVVDGGTAWRGVRQNLPGIDAAGKTGTTNSAADAWFIGYTPQLVCGVWVGFDDKRITFDNLDAEGYGGKAAAPIFGKLMNKIYNDYTLPYKQRKFVFNRDTLNTDSTPKPKFNYTPKQLELEPELQEIENTNNGNNNQQGDRTQTTQPILPPLPSNKKRDTLR